LADGMNSSRTIAKTAIRMSIVSTGARTVAQVKSAFSRSSSA
jgi:hypothetical protein